MDKEETEKEQNQKPTVNRAIWFLVRIAVAGSIISYLFLGKKDDLIKAFEQISYMWILFAFILYLIHILFAAWRWKLLLDVQKIKLTFYESLSLTMQGLFFSLFIPGGAVGGDIIKVGLLSQRTPKGTRFEGALAILVDRIIGMTALFSLALVAAVLAISSIMSMQRVLQISVLLITGACVTGLAATIVIFFHRTLERVAIIKRLMIIGDKYSHGMVTRLGNALDLYKGSAKTILFCFLISLFGCHLNLVLIGIFIMKSLKQIMTPFAGFLLSIVYSMVAGVVPITPSGLGTRELLMKNLLVLNGVNPGIETAIPLLFTSFVLSFSLFGGVFFIFQPKAEKQTINSMIQQEQY